MATSSVPDAILAKTLAAPYSPRSQGNPLSYRFTPEGELVVIAADGRKLWFSAVEISRARKALIDEARLRERARAASRQQVVTRQAPKSTTTPRVHDKIIQDEEGKQT